MDKAISFEQNRLFEASTLSKGLKVLACSRSFPTPGVCYTGVRCYVVLPIRGHDRYQWWLIIKVYNAWLRGKYVPMNQVNFPCSLGVHGVFFRPGGCFSSCHVLWCPSHLGRPRHSSVFNVPKLLFVSQQLANVHSLYHQTASQSVATLLQGGCRIITKFARFTVLSWIVVHHVLGLLSIMMTTLGRWWDIPHLWILYRRSLWESLILFCSLPTLKHSSMILVWNIIFGVRTGQVSEFYLLDFLVKDNTPVKIPNNDAARWVGRIPDHHLTIPDDGAWDCAGYVGPAGNSAICW